jgi:hypothetical protein
MIRPLWNAVVVRPEDGDPLQGETRLVALLLWLRGEPSPGLAFLDGAGARLTDPMAVDWRHFPLQDAIDAGKVARR